MMDREALRGREKTLGNEHPDSLTNIGNLASLLQDQDKYEQAGQQCGIANYVVPG